MSMTHTKRQRLLSVFALISFAEFSNSLSTPVLTFVFFASDSSLFASHTSFAMRSLYYGYALALQKIGSLIAQIALGAASDRFGRKTMLSLSFMGKCVVGFGCSLSLLIGSPILFIIGLIIGDVLYSVKSTSLAIVGDMSTPEAKVTAMSRLQLFIDIGACLGPIMGGAIAAIAIVHTHYLAPFLLIIAMGIIGFVAIQRYFPESHTQENATPTLHKQAFWQYLRSSALWKMIVLLVLPQMSWAAYYEFIGPIMKKTFHLSSGHLGLFFGVIAFSLMLTTGLLIPWLKRLYSTRKLIVMSTISALIGLALSILASLDASQLWAKIAIWCATFPIAAGDVVIYCLLIAKLSNMTPHAHHGKVMGPTYALFVATWSIVAAIGGHLMAISPLAPLYFSPIGMLLLLIALLYQSGLRLKTPNV